MSSVVRLLATVREAVRHLVRHPATAMMLVAGLAAPVAIAVGVPLYSTAASSRLFDEQVGQIEDDDGPRVGDLSYLFSYNRLSGGSRDWADVAPLDDRLFGDASPEGLPTARNDRFIETESFTLLSSSDPETAERLGSVTLASATNFDDIAQFSDGAAPLPAGPDAGSAINPIEVAVEANFAEMENLSVDQEVTLFDRTAELNAPLRSMTVLVTGIWSDGGSPDNLVGADAFRRRFVVPSSTITDAVSPRRPDAIQNVKWKITLDQNRLTNDRVDSIVQAGDRLEVATNSLLPGTRRIVAPTGLLRSFQSEERALQEGLRSFSLPMLALSIAVGLLIINMALRARAGEFTMLRRRGVPRLTLLVGAGTEAVIITLGALVPGVAGALLVAHVVGRTTTFFRLASFGDSGFNVAMSSAAWQSLTVVAVALFALQVLGAVLATRRSALSSSRSDEPADRPWWQRSYIDLFAIVLIATLAVRGVRDDTGRAALLDDPAVVLLPSATALAVGLVVLRVAPLMMRGVAALLARTEHTAALLAARRAARVPGDIAAPLLLLVITASLATFTASLAVTLDLQLLDTAHHSVGGDEQLRDQGQTAPVFDRAVVGELADVELPPGITTTAKHPKLSDYARVWGIDTASPIVELNGSAVYERGEIAGFQFIGVDPRSFAELAFWRSDYASRSLADLMSALESSPDAVLLSNGTALSVGIGDEIALTLRPGTGTVDYTAVVVGRFDQFPTWFPDSEPPLIVGRAQLVEDLAGATSDRRVLLDQNVGVSDPTRTDFDYAAIGASSRRSTVTADAVATRAQSAPGRQGVLGLLTIGVALATVLTLAGFVIATVLAFRRRTTEVGVLRAMGMKRREVAVLALFDLATVMLVGLVAAIGLGLAMSRWFIPVLVDTPPGAAPELLPTVAWGAAATIALLLAVLLATSAVIVAAALRRIRVFEAIRLGES